MMTKLMIRAAAVGSVLLAGGGCVPYTVATTATPLRPGERASTMVTYGMPKIGRIDSTRHMRETPVSYLAVDYEWRMGIDGKSDVGLRVPSASGLIVTYKRVLSDSTRDVRSAVISGAGLVNMGQHAHFELTWLLSKAEGAAGAQGLVGFTPYGGVRLMQVAPIAEGAVVDRPTVGAFVGTRIGSLGLGVSPEIGFFHDHSALGLRERSFVIVPAVAVHGDELIRIVRGRPSRSRGPDHGPHPHAPRFPALVLDAPTTSGGAAPPVLLPAGTRSGEPPSRGARPTIEEPRIMEKHGRPPAAPRGPVRPPRLTPG